MFTEFHKPSNYDLIHFLLYEILPKKESKNRNFQKFLVTWAGSMSQK